jgi:hypothetical protein
MQGLKTDGIKQVDVHSDGSAVRLILQQGDELIWLDLPTENLAGSMGLLVSAIEKARSPNEVTASIVADLEVDLDQAGDVLLTLENSTQAKMTYLLNIDLVTQLSAFLDTALQTRSGSSQAH